MCARGFHEQEDFRAGFDFFTPPIVGFEFWDKVGAGDEPRPQGGMGQLPGDFQIRSGDEDEDKFPGGFQNGSFG